MKKALSYICSALIVAVFALGLTACANDKPSAQRVSSRDVYALSAISGASYLRTSGAASSSVLYGSRSALNTGDKADKTHPSTITDADVAGIKDCLTMFEGILTSGVKQTVTENNDTGEYADYAFVMTMNVPDTAGGYERFVMYYNEVETETETEIKNGVEESEVSTKLEGVMVVGDEAFDVSGEREVEKEGDEIESSIEFTTKSRTHSDDFVKVSQSVENGEIEYEYEIYKDGKKIRELEVEIEQDEFGGAEREFSLKDKTGDTLNKTKYKAEKKADEDAFEIKFSTETATDSIIAKKTEGGYEFVYSNGFTETVLNSLTNS